MPGDCDATQARLKRSGGQRVGAAAQTTSDSISSMRIESLRKYQRRRRSGRFDDLPPPQRAAAEAHYHRLCARWGENLPQWRRAILVGRAKDLAIRPRDEAWARRLRRQGKTRSVTPLPSALASAENQPRAATQPVPNPHLPVELASCSEPIKLASSSPVVKMASSLAEPSISPTPAAHTVRLDVRGVTPSGVDGYDTSQRILADIAQRAFSNPHFSMAVPGKDLPPRWAWRLEVVPVP